jgi:hypothetical protein
VKEGQIKNRNSSNLIYPITGERLDHFLETPRFDNPLHLAEEASASHPQPAITSLKELLKPTQDIDDLRLSISEELAKPRFTPEREQLSEAREELRVCKKELDTLRLQNHQLENTLMHIGEKLSQEIKEKCDLVVTVNSGSQTSEPRG